MGKQKLKINEENLLTQLEKEDMRNWLIVEGVKQYREGKKIGKNMKTFLRIMGIIDEPHYI